MPEVATAALRIAYHEQGTTRGGLPILWVQGLGADHTAWSVNLAHFGPTHRCIAPDNRDVGATRWVTDGPPAGYTVAEMAADALAVLTGLGIPRAHVVGLSLGGSIAQELALRWPERVDRLVLVSAFARPHPRLRALLEAWIEIYARVDRQTFYRQAAAWMFADRYFAHERNLSALLGYVRRAPHPQDPTAFVRQCQASLGHDTLDRLGALAVPTLVVGGAEDIMVPRQRQEELAAAISGARLRLIEGAGHSVNLEAQIAFNAAVRDFLGE